MTRKALPLEAEDLEELRATAENAKERLPIDVIPGTGLSLQEFLHLRPSWIEWPNGHGDLDVPLIRVPQEAPCARDVRQPAYQTVLQPVSREPPCHDCERQPGPDKFFVKEQQYDRRVRSIPVADETAAETLRWWFHRYDCIPLARNLTGISTVVDRTSVTNVSPDDLRWTFARRLADMEFGRDDIAEVMGVSPKAKAMYRALRASSTDYGIRCHHGIEEYLDAIGEPGDTATSNEIAARLGLQNQSVTKRLRDHDEHSPRFEVVREGRSGATPNVYRRLEE